MIDRHLDGIERLARFAPAPDDPMTLDVLIPVLNEQQILRQTVVALVAYLSDQMANFDWRIVIVDNGSTDRTPALCRDLSDKFGQVTYLRLEIPGRGRALKFAMAKSDADIVAYMDVDLSTKLRHFRFLILGVATGRYDISVGSRLDQGAKVIGRPLKRELISRAYSALVRGMFRTSFKDPQCGFKALSRRAAGVVAQVVKDDGWFFDTELLIIAERNGYDVGAMPVEWVDDPDSRVRILSTAWRDIKGLLRMRFGGLRKARRLLEQLEAKPAG